MRNDQFQLHTPQKIEQWICGDQIATTLFNDIYRFARPMLGAYVGDLYHDCLRLAEFERDCVYRMAAQSRDEFTYLVKLSWGCRSTGSDLVWHGIDGKWWQATVDANTNPLIVHYSFAMESDCTNRLTLWRTVDKCPHDWLSSECDENGNLIYCRPEFTGWRPDSQSLAIAAADEANNRAVRSLRDDRSAGE